MTSSQKTNVNIVFGAMTIGKEGNQTGNCNGFLTDGLFS